MIIIPNKNVEEDNSYGTAVNIIIEKYTKRSDFGVVLLELGEKGDVKNMLFDESVKMTIEFNREKILEKAKKNRNLQIKLGQLKKIGWTKKQVSEETVKIILWRFDKDYWILNYDFKDNLKLFKKIIVKTVKVRGGGYLPFEMRKQEKEEFMKGLRDELEKELPAMWSRYLTTTQRYRGTMCYDGNYFDLFSHAQDLFILGHYFETIQLCRIATEQALLSILAKSGNIKSAYRNGNKIKSIEGLVEACRNKKLFPKKFPIDKISAKKLNKISNKAGDLTHLKLELVEEDKYKEDALFCMDNLSSVIKKHLNFIKDTKQTSGYKISGKAKRLK